jgi:hypothetical protein
MIDGMDGERGAVVSGGRGYYLMVSFNSTIFIINYVFDNNAIQMALMLGII